MARKLRNFHLILDILRPSKTAFLPLYLLHAKRLMKFLADVDLPEQFIRNKNRIKHQRSYKSCDRSVRNEGDVSSLDNDCVFDNEFQRQWRILESKQTNGN